VSLYRLEDSPCVVLGGGITALGVVRSLGRLGSKPYLVSPRGDLAARSRWVAAHVDDVSETDDPDALERALADRGLGRAVLFPCSDTWALAVSRMSEGARGNYPRSISPPAVLELLVDKALFCAAAQRFDVPHPATRVIVSADEIDVSELSGYFLKPSNSQRFNARYSDKAYTFSSIADAREGLRLMEAVGVDALLQEYIPGPPTLHYFVDGYLDKGGTLRAIFVRQRTRMFPVTYGNSTHMVTVTPESAKQAVSDVVRLLAGIHFHGAFSAEFKRDPRDGVFKILEVNGRPWWYIGFAADCGVDVPMLSFREALGLALPPLPRYRAGVQCVLLHLDIRAFFYERRAHGLRFGDWLRSVVGARSTVFSWQDPRPAVFLLTGMARTWTRRTGRKVLPRGG
jgi:predicted ATP-grasp superfamily ATP-dependent carboligase